MASLPTNSSSGGSFPTSGSEGSATTTPPKGNATRLVDEWAACMRSHGDPSQADPIIDSHGVINITISMGASKASAQGAQRAPIQAAGDAHGVVGTCSQYLAAAQVAARAADLVPDPLGMDNQADLLKYVNCMQASGVPNYPYPQGNTTNFNGTGVDPTSPPVVKISIRCGNKLHLPLWWSAGWGPPGDVTVTTAGLNPNRARPACAYQRNGCGANGGGGLVRTRNGAGANPVPGGGG